MTLRAFAFHLLLSLGALSARAEDLRPVRLAAPIQLRGDLSDPAWARARVATGPFMSYNPMRGHDFPQRTEVYLAYDAQSLYVGFYAHDTEPGRIKASLSKRDAMFDDDWVGLSLDTFGTNSSALHLFINPLGIQGDALDTVNSNEDSAPDWVWESKGRLQPDGYTVEVRIPLKSIRFRSGKDVRMGILFWRRVSRLGMSASWPAMAAGQWVHQAHVPVRFEQLDAPLRLEVMPSVTYSQEDRHLAPGDWSRERRTSAGLGVKLGLGSATTADLTYKPDFSQVESDAFQMEVNQRYPVFYSEKRPFFMESMGVFNLAGTGGDANMKVPVHTRRIVDPLWGAKVTGDDGPVSYGVLAAADRAPGQPWLDGVNPAEGRRAGFTIGRAMYGLGSGSYVGVLYTGRQFDGSSNRVGGLDFSYRMSDRHTLTGNVLATRSSEPGAPEEQAGEGHLLNYSYSSQPLDLNVISEHYGRAFRMDTAFYNRVGIDQTTFYVGPNFYPKLDWAPWIHKINPFLFGYVIQDRITGLTDYLALASLRLNTTRGGSLRVDLQRAREGWQGRLFSKTVYKVQGGAWITKGVFLSGNASYTYDLLYGAAVPFQGRTVAYGASVILQPSDELRLNVDLASYGMRDPHTGQQVFDAKTLNCQGTYQFNSAFFLRATLRSDSFLHRMLTDYLASFTYIPGTVVFLGYGEILVKNQWQGEAWQLQGTKYEPMQRGLFLKVSYLWRN